MTTDQTRKLNSAPRHAGATREVPLVGYQPRHQPKHPNATADGATAQSWAIVDPQPTKALRRPTPHPAPNVTIGPPARRVSKLRVAACVAVWAVIVVAVVALVLAL